MSPRYKRCSPEAGVWTCSAAVLRNADMFIADVDGNNATPLRAHAGGRSRTERGIDPRVLQRAGSLRAFVLQLAAALSHGWSGAVCARGEQGGEGRADDIGTGYERRGEVADSV